MTDYVKFFAGSKRYRLEATAPDVDGIQKIIVQTDLASSVDGLETLLTAISGYVDGLEGGITGLTTLATALNGYVDGLEGKLDTLHTDIATTLSAFVDGLETLITSSNTKLDTLHTDLATTLAGYVDGLEGLLASPSTGAITSVNDTNSDVTILASNASRKGATIFNDSTAILYLALANTTASSTNYSVQVPAGGYYELPVSKGGVYTGVIKGIWASDASGAARVTELT